MKLLCLGFNFLSTATNAENEGDDTELSTQRGRS